MSDHTPHPMERHCDVAVIGGSAVGLAAALQLGQQRRSVIVIDSGDPRHALAAHMHGSFEGEGLPPSESISAGREEARSYGGEVLVARATETTLREDGRFQVELSGGHCIIARRVLAATGPTHELPVPGLYAASSVADPSQQVVQAAAEGSRIGAMISVSLADEDLRAAARPSANEEDWDNRYGSKQMWSGNPNGTLVKEITGLAPGRALDVGAGEGGDALWLAEQGWKVTASDISGRALDRINTEAERRGLIVECHQADANALGAFEPAAFDLVSVQYASIPRTPDDRGVRNLLDAVALGGMLLAVSHDLEPMRAPIDTWAQSRVFDPDAYVRVEDLARVVNRSPEWEIEVLEKRPRPPGAASASHHVDDIVLRARRRAG